MISVAKTMLPAVLLSLFMITAANGQATLTVGSDAPPLVSAEFLRGEPVKSLEKGKTYVIDFWATWCIPCRASFPHISRLQEKYKDIVFIGQDVLEEDAGPIKPYVKQQGERMSYRVATDEPLGEAGKMFTTWMKAAGQDQLPTVFIVNGEGKIIYIGGSNALDRVLADYTAGTFDSRKEVALEASRKQMETIMQKAIEANDLDAALAAIDTFTKEHPDAASEVRGAKLDLLVHKKDFAGATAVAKTLADENQDDAGTLDFIAWTFVNPTRAYEKPDLNLAEQCAMRANELAKEKDDQFLDTLAHVQAAKGDKAKAIETETKAMALATPGKRARMQKYLVELSK